MRSAVVLPEPDGPTRTMNSPSAICEVERVDRRRLGPGIDPRRLLERARRPSARLLPAFEVARRRRPARARSRAWPRAVRAELVEARAAQRRRSAATLAASIAVAARAVQPRLDPARAGGIVRRPHQPAAEHHLGRLVDQVEPRERRPRERDDLDGQPVDDLRGDGRRRPRRPARPARARSRSRSDKRPTWIAARELERRRRGRSAPARGCSRTRPRPAAVLARARRRRALRARRRGRRPSRR